MQAKLLRVARVSVMALVLTFVISVFLLPYWQQRQYLYKNLVSRHQRGHEPRVQGQKPFLYASWFANGNIKTGEEVSVYDNGFRYHRRFYPRAVQGGGGLMANTRAFQALQQVSSLPPILPRWNLVPRSSYLLVSLRDGSTWTTRYYDARNPPAEIARIRQNLQAR